jgi:hypothetical protein
LKDTYPDVYFHLKYYEDHLKSRGQVKAGQHHWLELDNNPNETYLNQFLKPKLMCPDISTSLFAIYEERGFYTANTCYIMTSNSLNLKYLSALLSSKLLDFFFKLLSNPLARTSTNPDEKPRYRLFKIYLEKLPIYPAHKEEQQCIIEKSDRMSKLNLQLQNEINGLKQWIQKEFKVVKLSKKLETYFELSEDEFIEELRKKKVNTKSRKNREYLEREFNESLTIINPLIQEIEQTDKEIDQMVYELYGLTEEEIKIIEDSLN